MISATMIDHIHNKSSETPVKKRNIINLLYLKIKTKQGHKPTKRVVKTTLEQELRMPAPKILPGNLRM